MCSNRRAGKSSRCPRSRRSTSGSSSRRRSASGSIHAVSAKPSIPIADSLATLDQIRRTLGEYNFAGQYQQTPAPAGGGMVREAWFPRYRPVELPANFDQKIQSWDTANKPSDLADYSVCTTWGVNRPQLLSAQQGGVAKPSPAVAAKYADRLIATLGVK